MTSFIEIYSETLFCIREIVDSIVKSQSQSQNPIRNSIIDRPNENLKAKVCNESSQNKTMSKKDTELINNNTAIKFSNKFDHEELKLDFDGFWLNKLNLKFDKLNILNLNSLNCALDLDDFPKESFHLYSKSCQLTTLFQVNMLDLFTLLDYLSKVYYYKLNRQIKQDDLKMDLSIPLQNMSLNTAEHLHEPIYSRYYLGSLSNISIDEKFIDENCYKLFKNLNLNVNIKKSDKNVKRLRKPFVKFNSFEIISDSIPSSQINSKISTLANDPDLGITSAQLIVEDFTEFGPTQPFEIENFDIFPPTQQFFKDNNTAVLTQAVNNELPSQIIKELSIERENTKENEPIIESKVENTDKFIIPTQIVTQAEECSNKPKKVKEKMNKQGNKLFIDFIPANSNLEVLRGQYPIDISVNMTQCGTIFYDEKLRKHLEILNKSDMAQEGSIIAQPNSTNANSVKKAVKRRIFMKVGLSKKQKVKTLLPK